MTETFSSFFWIWSPSCSPMAHKSSRSAMGSTLATLMYCQESSMITCSLWSVILTSNSLLKPKIDFVNENGSAKHSYSQAGIGKNGENWCVCCLAQRIFDIKTDGAWRAHYPNKISMTTPVLGGWDESCLGRSEGPDLLTKGRWNPQNHSSEKIEKKYVSMELGTEVWSSWQTPSALSFADVRKKLAK